MATRPALGLIVAVVPSVIASAIIIQFVDLEKYKESAIGKYVHTYMTSTIQALRLAGLTVMLVGA